MKKIIIIVVVLAVVGIGWYVLSPFFIRKTLNEQSPVVNIQVDGQNNNQATTSEPGLTSDSIISEGNFIPQVHNVSGKATIINTGDKNVLRFEDFSTLNGPNLHVYLSKDLEAKDFVDIGPLKATDGNFNYDLATTIDPTAYKYVLIWCVDFKVLFGSAELK